MRCLTLVTRPDALADPGSILDISDVHYRWPGRADFELSVPHLSLADGETALLLGRSGSGKSTLLSLICGTMLPNEGRVTVDGQNLASLSAPARDRFRAERIGVIFQQFNLLPFGSVADNVALPLNFAPKRRAKVTDIAEEAARLITALGLPKEALRSAANKLSVGQQQRVAVARALIGAPPLVIADEPTSALDADSQAAFLELMFAQLRETGSSLLMVSHDARLGDHFDRVIDMAVMTEAGA